MPEVPPLTAVAYAFRTKPAFQGLPYVVDCVSVFLDSSVDLSLLYAVKIGSVRLLERIWTSSENLEHDPDHLWTLRKYLRTDKHYGQYLFSKGLEDAVPRQDMSTIKWLLIKFQGFSISSEVVARACKAGAMDLLQLFYENDSRVLEQRGEIGRGHSIKWGNLTMSAAVLSRRSDIVWWLHRHIPDANYDLDAALRSALIMGDIIMAEWLASHGARRSKHSVDITTRGVAANGRLDVLQWLVDKGRCKNIIAMVPIAAQNGHLEMLRWIVDWTLQKNAAVKRDVVAMAMAAIHVAATHGHLQTAKYLRDIALQAGCIGYTMFFTGDGLDVILCDERVSGTTMIMAAKKGFLDVVQWLYTEYGHDCQTDIFNIGVRRRGRLWMDANAMDTAAKYGHLDVLKYFHELQYLEKLACNVRRTLWMVLLKMDTCVWLSSSRQQKRGLHYCSDGYSCSAWSFRYGEMATSISNRRLYTCSYGWGSITRTHRGSRMATRESNRRLYDESYGQRSYDWASRNGEMATFESVGGMYPWCDGCSSSTWAPACCQMATFPSNGGVYHTSRERKLWRMNISKLCSGF